MTKEKKNTYQILPYWARPDVIVLYIVSEDFIQQVLTNCFFQLSCGPCSFANMLFHENGFVLLCIIFKYSGVDFGSPGVFFDSVGASVPKRRHRGRRHVVACADCSVVCIAASTEAQEGSMATFVMGPMVRAKAFSHRIQCSLRTKIL